jgi:DedD protein
VIYSPTFLKSLTSQRILDSTVPDPQLKNRIFGAILLVILAVLLIPIFLGEPRSNIEIPQKENKKLFQSKIQPLPGSEGGVDPSTILGSQELDVPKTENTESTGLVLKQLDTSSASETPDEQQSEDVTTTELTTEKPAKESTQEVAEPTEPIIEEGWALQAGIFSKKANAESIMKILSRHGFTPNSSQTQVSFGEATRVWMGPLESKQKAQELSSKLESIIGSGGYIAPYPFK